LRFGIDNPVLIEPFLESTIWGQKWRMLPALRCAWKRQLVLSAARNTSHPQSLWRAFGFTFDSFQAAESGVAPETLIAAMDGALTTVHLADYAPAGPRHLAPGAGTIDWRVVFTALSRIAYTGPLLIEVARPGCAKNIVRDSRFHRGHARGSSFRSVICR
jgi:hypothetical protein